MTAAFELDLYGARGKPTMRLAIPASTNDLAVGSATNTTAALTFDADSVRKNQLSQVVWSYSGTPTGGRLTVQDGAGTVVRDVDIAVSGPGSITFEPPLVGSVNTALIVSLFPAGNVTGKVNATVWKLL